MVRRSHHQGGNAPPGRNRPRNWSDSPAAGAADDIIVPAGQPDLISELRSTLGQVHPLGFLAEASSIIEALDSRDRDPFAPDRDNDTPTVQEMTDILSSSGRNETASLAAAFAHLALLDEDRQHAHQVVTDRHLRQIPSWLADLAQTEVAGALAMGDILGDGTNVMIGLTLPGGHPLTILVYVDHVDGHSATDGFAIPDTLEGVERAYRQAGTAELQPHEQIEFRPLDPRDAAAMIVEAVDLGARTFPRYETESWPAARPLVEWVTRLVGPGGTSGLEWQEWSEGQIGAAVAGFLDGEHGREHRSPESAGLVDTLIWFGNGYGHGDPYQWSPKRIEQFLFDWVPRKLIDESTTLRRIPDLLRSFIRHGHALRDIPATVTEAVVDTIRIMEPEFNLLIGETRDAPLSRALAEVGGYDLSDIPGLGDLTFNDSLFAAEDAPGGSTPNGSRPVLPDEEIPWDEIDESVRDRVEIVAGHIDRACDALLSVEYRTACRRLLTRTALGEPAIFTRRSRDDYTAMAVIWAIGQANGLFDGEFRVKDLTGFFEAKPSNLSQRAATLLTAAGLPDRPMDGLGDPSLLVSERSQS